MGFHVKRNMLFENNRISTWHLIGQRFAFLCNEWFGKFGEITLRAAKSLRKHFWLFIYNSRLCVLGGIQQLLEEMFVHWYLALDVEKLYFCKK